MQGELQRVPKSAKEPGSAPSISALSSRGFKIGLLATLPSRFGNSPKHQPANSDHAANDTDGSMCSSRRYPCPPYRFVYVAEIQHIIQGWKMCPVLKKHLVWLAQFTYVLNIPYSIEQSCIQFYTEQRLSALASPLQLSTHPPRPSLVVN